MAGPLWVDPRFLGAVPPGAFPQSSSGGMFGGMSGWAPGEYPTAFASARPTQADYATSPPFPPEPTSTPARAQPTAGRTAMPNGVLSNNLGGGNGLLPFANNPIDQNRNAILGYLAGALQGGNVGQSIGRGLEGFITGGQADAEQGTRNAAAQGLLEAGMNPAMATAIAANPKYLSVWQSLNPELKIQTIQDSWGNQSVIGVNPRSGVGQPITMGALGAAGMPSVSGAPGSPLMKGGPQASVGGLPSAQEVSDRITASREAGMTDPAELTKHIPDPGTAAYTRALLRGDALPTNLGPRAGAVRGNAIQFAHIIDPNFREEQITERQAFARNMSSSAPNSVGSQIRSAGTVVNHIGSGLDNLAVVAKGAKGVPLGTGEYGNQPELNAVRGIVNRRANDAEYNKAYGGYLVDSKGVAGEVVRLLTGGQGSERDRKEWQDRFDVTKNPIDEVRGAWNEAYNIMFGRLEEIARQKERAYNTSVDPLMLLDDRQRKIMERVRQMGAAPGTEGAPQQSAPTQSTPTAPARTPPPVGEIRGGYRFKGGDPSQKNNWEPAT